MFRVRLQKSRAHAGRYLGDFDHGRRHTIARARGRARAVTLGEEGRGASGERSWLSRRARSDTVPPWAKAAKARMLAGGIVDRARYEGAVSPTWP